MKLLVFFLFSTMLITFASCIEIIDDLTLNNDGSGSYNYTVNLSSSKVKINSILLLDSLDGKKVPALTEIAEKLERITNTLTKEEGISNVKFQSDYTNYIFKIRLNFSSLASLQASIKKIVKQENEGKAIPSLDDAWLIFKNDTLVRSIPQITIEKASQINMQETRLLKEGRYTSITRFDKEIKFIENENAKISKSNKAVMVQINPYKLTQNAHLLDNTIVLKSKLSH